jgi:hypothetical protein
VSESFLVTDELLSIEGKSRWALTPPASIVEAVPLRVVVGDEPGVTDTVSVIQLSCALTKRTKLHWIWQATGKTFCDTMSYTPTVADIGKVIIVQIRDRLRDSTLTECELPPVTAAKPTVSRFALKLEPLGGNQRRISLTGSYHGGTEGRSLTEWFVTLSGRANPHKVTETLGTLAMSYIDIKPEFDGAVFRAVYHPVCAETQEAGEPVVSDSLEIPVSSARTQVCITAELGPTEDYQLLECRVSVSQSTVEYQWGNTVNGSPQYSRGDTAALHQIVPRDFEHPPVCHIFSASLNAEVIATLSVPLADLFVPTVTNPEIQPRNGKRDKPYDFMIGQELCVTFDYRGPPVLARHFAWQRSSGGSWKTIAEAEFYTPSSNDAQEKIRAVGTVMSRGFSAPVTSEAFTTAPIRVDRGNSVLTRIAGTMKRAGKAQFDGRLPMGEAVTACLENGVLILKGVNATVMLRAQLTYVQAEALDAAPASVTLRARHGYCTELTLLEKRLNGGLRFAPEQARDLFLETLTAFTASSGGNGPIWAALAAFRAAGKAQFKGRVAGEGVVLTIDDTALVVRGDRTVLLRSLPAHVHAEPTEPSGSCAVLRTRHGQALTMALSEKKVAGGVKLTAEQTRELLFETMAAFAVKK